MEDEDFTSSHTPLFPPPQSVSSLGLLPPSFSQFNCIIFVKFTFNIYYIYIDTVFCSILWLCFLLEYFYLSGNSNCLGFNLFNLLCIFYLFITRIVCYYSFITQKYTDRETFFLESLIFLFRYQRYEESTFSLLVYAFVLMEYIF